MTHISVFVFFGWVDLALKDHYGLAGNLAIVATRLIMSTLVAAGLWYGMESRILKLKRRFATAATPAIAKPEML